MAKIKHIAIRTSDVEKTVAFYKGVFELKQVGRGLSGIYLSDGHINLAILKYQPEKNQEPTKMGIDHIGFLVEDVDGTLTKLGALGGKTLTDRVQLTPTDPNTPQSYFEVRCTGPDDQVLDVSAAGWVGTD
jgi:methylmalonyl-CoA/ethylmalonyl-CoA epimerase